ncbi:MAG: septal ring lytic transglycosylase RlpA family lipoprotein [Coxiella sp. (in: Bacteria)]|nr:MAG: septal ring lytic transglycosylase RlpA family lipoprotein [Coxiella sp. (in: g-proteobacteria)]
MAYVNYLSIFALSALLAGCDNPQMQTQDGPPLHQKNVSLIPNATPRYLAKSRFGNPPSYQVNGQTYHVLNTAVGYNQRGIASWYGSKFTNKLTSTRERYDPYKMTAASPVLPIPCFARVTNLGNGRSVIVKVNDRGPFAPNRIIDLSYAAAIKLGYEQHGTALVEVAAIDVNNPYPNSPNFNARHPQLYLQLGAFSEYPNAHRLQQQIAYVTDRTTHIRTSDIRHKILYRVQLGPLKGVGESDRLQALLQKEGYGRAITLIQ